MNPNVIFYSPHDPIGMRYPNIPFSYNVDSQGLNMLSSGLMIH